MTKLKQLFEIDDYNLYDEEIEVFLMQDEKEKEVNVPRARFEKWLENTDRLEWVNDYADHAGEHVQETGTMPTYAYWQDVSREMIKRDLYEFIILKMMDVRKIFDIENPLKSILNSFKTAI